MRCRGLGGIGFQKSRRGLGSGRELGGSGGDWGPGVGHGSRRVLGIWEGLGVQGSRRALGIWKGVKGLRMKLGSRRGQGVQEGTLGSGRGSSLSKNPQHVYNTPKYFFFYT